MIGIGRLIGKAAGELAVSPLTIGAQIVEAAEAAAEQAEEAVGRAIEGRREG